MGKKIIKKVEKHEEVKKVEKHEEVKKVEKHEEEVSVITEAVISGDGNFRYTVSSNKNLNLGLCNISN